MASNVTVSCDDKPMVQSVYGNLTLTDQGEICVHTSDDRRRTCCIRGITMVHPDKLVLTDCDNNSIKLLDLNTNTITSQLAFKIGNKNAPLDITTTSSSQVAVTVPYSRHIQFISVSDKLCLSHTIPTHDQCYAICCHQNILIVTYHKKLQMMDMTGQVFQQVNNIFNMPWHVQANSDHIYILDRSLDEVIMLNWQAEVCGKIKDLENPKGLTLLPDGSILVCDSDTVYHVSGDCNNRRAVLQHVKDLCAVCVDAGGHKLYISRSTDDVANNILVYEIT